MSSFFTIPTSQRKRKRGDAEGAPAAKKRSATQKIAEEVTNSGSKSATIRDESISGSESEIDEGLQTATEDEEGISESDAGETAAERRLRLAEQYLENVREEVDEVGFDAAEIDRDLIAERLREDVDESKGRAYRHIASQLSFATASYCYFRADTQSTTSVALHYPWVYTVSKDKTLIKWQLAPPQRPGATSSSHTTETNGDVRTSLNNQNNRICPRRKRPKKIKSVQGLLTTSEGSEPQGHKGSILSVAVSPSGSFVATGGADRRLIIWDADALIPLKTFTQHRDIVSSVSFTQRISPTSTGEQLFSASFDRTIKTWSLNSGGHAYVETLFGHQDNVISVASMTTDQCISVGARDRTARLWKVIEESQLVFRGGSSKGSDYVENTIDCVAAIPPAHFVTGSDSGNISLWSIYKKKPLYTVHQAHGLDPFPPEEEQFGQVVATTIPVRQRWTRRTPRWITALATVPGTDIILSGSWDGWIRAWQISEDKRKLNPLGTVGGHQATMLSPGVEMAVLPPLDANGVSIEGNDGTLPPLRGFVNDIAVFERREQHSKGMQAKQSNKKSGESAAVGKGLCVVAAVGKEHRLGRWKVLNRREEYSNGSTGRNGAVVFEVPFVSDLPEIGE